MLITAGDLREPWWLLIATHLTKVPQGKMKPTCPVRICPMCQGPKVM